MIQDHNFPVKSRRLAALAAYGSVNGGEVADRVRRFMPMVRRLAWHLQSAGRDGIELEDLMQAGLVALTECAQRHAGPNEDGFAAYAKMRVRGAMVDMIRRQVPLSRGALERRRLVRDKETQLRSELGRDPSEAEIAAGLGLNLAEMGALRHAAEPLRFEPMDETYSDENMAFADATPDALAILTDQEMRESLIAAISDLPERLQMVIQLYFVEELNLVEIAQVLEVSIPRVHQLKAQALEKLKQALGDEMELV
ncbi:MAG: hypothetical protein RLY97_1735 [Pseudomonadota bacterium]